MATSVKLKACGGLAPYRWSSTGDIELSATTGVNVTVSTTGAGVNNFPGSVAWTTVAFKLDQFTDNGSCGAGRFSTVQWSSALVTLYDCSHDVISTTGGMSTDAQQRIQGSASLCGGSTLDITEDAGTTNSNNAANTSPDGALGLLTVTMSLAPLNDQASAYSQVQTSGLLAFPGTTITFPGEMDIRSQAMVNGGCEACDNPSGATVTVTDAIGVSVTYVF